MRRRDFITLLGGGAAAWPHTARAQQGDRVRRLGVITSYAESDATARRWIATLVTGLRELGWTVGDNIQIEYRWPADVGRINSAAAELVGLKPDVIVATGPLTVAALQRLTSTIPIVFQGIADPVSTGIVASLARPGGNITGFGLGEFTISGKVSLICSGVDIGKFIASLLILIRRERGHPLGHYGLTQHLRWGSS